MSAYIEKNCTVTHEGKSFTAGGAFVSNSHIIAYPAKGGQLHDWHGQVLGKWWVISSRPAVFFGHHSWMGSTYYYMRARLKDGRTYSLRGFGEGMSATGRRVKP